MVIFWKESFLDFVGDFQKLTEFECRREYKTPTRIKLKKEDIENIENSIINKAVKFTKEADFIVLEKTYDHMSCITYLTIKCGIYKKISI